MGRETVSSPDVTVTFDGQRCIHSRHCVLDRPDVFVPNVQGAWIHPERATPGEVLLVTHSGRDEAVVAARLLARELSAAGITVVVPPEEREDLTAGDPDLAVAVTEPGARPAGLELVVVVGGDGTILRSAEYAVAADIPLLGVNLGHVGFLAELEPENVPDLVAAVVDRTYTVEERTGLSVRVLQAGREVWRTFALNEASVEKASRQRMIDLLLEIEGRPLSRWGCDGVVVASPTGSTAYAWSVGGPVIWPGVAAMMVAPISAHALFARPLVVDPTNTVALELGMDSPDAVLWCDGQRSHPVAPGARVEVTQLERPIRFARTHPADFTDRLVAKFHLPVDGWRGQGPQ